MTAAQATPRNAWAQDENYAVWNRLSDLVRAGDVDALHKEMDTHDYSPDIMTKSRIPLLVVACNCGKLPMLQALLSRGAEVTGTDFNGGPYLQYAFTGINKAEEAQFTRALLDAGADMEAQVSKDMDVRRYAEVSYHPDAANMMDYYAQMPKLGAIGQLGKADLFRPNENGFCLLHTPAAWRNWQAVTSQLACKGEYLSKEEMLAPMGEGQPSPLERAINCWVFDSAMRELEAQGEKLEPKDMLRDGKLASWVEALGETRQLRRFFTKEIWQGESPNLLCKVYDAMPRDYKEQVGNFYGLLSHLRYVEPERGR